ncbi:sulfite exporter TauE/SafE family protein [Anatilimnocola floriformis]|uniref:sulfite exporter TauE/SafE family protein n=1 Tax=Anatilimnocola floriformis TaxID=2948575 RepID=UPI0020C202E4|nr:sulfite exporter TauE/SafE family protein [Anatilimnocola floriformis]
MPDISQCIWLCLAAAVAGGVNALAGGGTLLTFPALIAAMRALGYEEDLAAVLANGTSTVALAPASFSSAWAYRQDLMKEWKWLKLLIGPSIVGGVLGTWLVTSTNPKYFGALVPWLIFGASLLFALQPLLTKKKAIEKADLPQPVPEHSLGKLMAIVLFQFMVAIYGGYFGAGIGILMLSALSLIGLSNMHEMNAIKTVLAGCINCMSVLVFTYKQKIHWPIAAMMMASAIAGGYLAAAFGRKVKPIYIRWLVIVIGFTLSAWYFYQRFTAK